ncbi:HTH domain-containing protein [Streptomyces sp. NPDC093260]|uniref:HTH domain-containing protein n=1 Tax=Streptomyces sp. NPDC093260 TaxID=3155073 RepID=UPI00341A275E
MGENQTLRSALEVAQRQLAEAEAELRDVQERVRNLRSVVYGLKQIFEPGDVDLSAELRQAAEGEAPTRKDVHPRRSQSASSRRAVQLLTEADRPMRMPEIIEEWQRRGWVDPSWRTPKSAINMIYQRALRAGLVDRMPDRSWVLSSITVDDQAGPATGGGGENQ